MIIATFQIIATLILIASLILLVKQWPAFHKWLNENKQLHRTLTFLWKWNELVIAPVTIFLWWLSDPLIRLIDPTAATFDMGLIQAIIIAFVFMVVIRGLNWLMLLINFPGLYSYIDEQLEEEFCDLPKTTRVRYALSFYFGSMLLMALLTIAVL
ncbi:MAG: hypothetical protein ACQETE_01530 [Bacteroidota bacterium]